MKSRSFNSKQKTERPLISTVSEAQQAGRTLTGHLIKSCLTVVVILALMTATFAQTQTGQSKPLTVEEAKTLLRASLDREKVLGDQLDAAKAHVRNVEQELKDANSSASVDGERIKNLTGQVADAKGQAAELRQALADERTASAGYKTALANAEKEVIRQKAKVDAANKRTLWGIVIGVVVGVLAMAAASK